MTGPRSPRKGGGYPSDWSQVPSQGVPESQAEGYSRMGYPPPRQVRMPLARDGVPPVAGYAWTGYAAGGTPLAVSHRRTFLLDLSATEKGVTPVQQQECLGALPPPP